MLSLAASSTAGKAIAGMAETTHKRSEHLSNQGLQNCYPGDGVDVYAKEVRDEEDHRAARAKRLNGRSLRMKKVIIDAYVRSMPKALIWAY